MLNCDALKRGRLSRRSLKYFSKPTISTALESNEALKLCCPRDGRPSRAASQAPPGPEESHDQMFPKENRNSWRGMLRTELPKKMNFTFRTLCAVTDACSVTDACGYFDAKRLCPVQNYRRSRCFEKMFPKEGRNVLGTMPDAQLCSRFLSCRDGRPSRTGRAAPLYLLLPSR